MIISTWLNCGPEKRQAVNRYLGWDKLGFDVSNSAASRTNSRSGSAGPTDALDELKGSENLSMMFQQMHELDRELYAFGEKLFDHALYSNF